MPKVAADRAPAETDVRDRLIYVDTPASKIETQLAHFRETLLAFTKYIYVR